MSKIRILAISGSTRNQSSSHAILSFLAKSRPELAFDIYEEIDQLPHFNPDLEHDALPETVRELRSRIEKADGVMICTPEYVFSLPGSLKNAIEWNVSTTLFSHKPTALIVAAASGEKAFESLHLIMSTLEVRMSESSVLLVKTVRGKIGADGTIADEKLRQNLADVLAALLDIIEASA